MIKSHPLPKPTAPKTSPLLASVLLATIFQANFYIGGLLLSPARLLYLIIAPIFLFRLLMGKYGRFNTIDFLVLLHVIWLSMAIFLNHPIGVAITYTGSNALLILGGYLAGRSLVRSKIDMRRMMILLTGLTLISLPFAVIETITGKMILARLIDNFPGFSGNKDVEYETRLGFHRVQFLFSHPIHYGLFCSCAFTFCLIGLRKSLMCWVRFFAAIGISFGTFLSVSSGPFLSLAAQIFLITWGAMMRRINHRWRILTIILGVIYITLEISSNRPAIYVIVSKLAFAPHTANLRLLLFEYGIPQVMRDPIFGIGFNHWPLPIFMSGSIDNYWLFLAIVFGLPTFLFLVGALGLMFFRVSRIRSNDPEYNNPRLAWCITMVSLILTLSTVAIWTEVLSLFYFIIGSGVWMTTYRPDGESRVQGPLAPTDAIENTSRYSRFPPTPSTKRHKI